MLRILIAASLLAGVLAAGGCAKPSAAESTSQTSAPEQRFEALVARYPDLTYQQLSAETPQRESLDKLSFAAATAKFYDEAIERLQLTEAERGLLDRNGFVSVDHGQRYSFGSLYFAVYTNDLPVLVTTDSILHAMHRTYDELLMDLEQTVLTGILDAVLRQCHDELAREAPNWGAAAKNYRDVDLYLTVARNLLAGAGAATGGNPRQGDQWDGDLLIHSKLEQDVAAQAILMQIHSLQLQSGAASDVTEIYGGKRAIDYSQFKPRGHYTKNVPLARYFRTMMWLGRADTGWNLLPPDPASGIVSDTPREVRDAALLVMLLEATGSMKQLAQMNAILNFMVGKSDNLGTLQLGELLEREEVREFGELAWGSQVERLQRALVAGGDGEQKIRSQVVLSDPQDLQQVAPPSVFQLFGQRFVIDSFVLSKVVYDSIIFDGQKVERHMPTGLDVMFALGNDAALPLLEEEATKFAYAANLKASREFVERQPQAIWSENLYNLWLAAIRTLDELHSQEARLPEAMRTAAWQRKQLRTQLASWAELRHNTVLYAKQSYGAKARCEYPTGYVEPYPDTYACVKRFAEEAARRIAAADFRVNGNDHSQLQERQVKFLGEMAATLGKLEMLAKKELAGEPFDAADQKWLKQTIDIRGGGSGRPRYSGWYCQLFYGGSWRSADWEPTVVDVHTDPNKQTVLEEAVGNCNFLVAAIDNDGDRMIYVGPTYTYYEFEQPAQNRLDDRQWGQMLTTGSAPEQPEWTESFQGETMKRHAGARVIGIPE